MTSPTRVALYLRTSHADRTVENQRQALTEVAGRRGWEIVAEFKDEAISGAKGRSKRPGFDKLLKGAVRRDFDMVCAWSVDRLGRSISDLIATLQELNGCGCALYLHQQALDTTTPSGRAMFQMLGVFAEFEREMITARVKAGLARAKAQGKVLGKHRTPERKVALERARALRAEGKSWREIALETNVPRGTLRRALREAAVPAFLA
jgi:DNA invertase Pin-like site-specific DNA recombinase